MRKPKRLTPAKVIDELPKVFPIEPAIQKEESITQGLPAAKIIAFYLPQFHPIIENNAWWGRGFTEWTNVSAATSYFPGHYQPQLPADLGFYDLRVLETQVAQADLAKEYGIHGFCYYYYWFSGRKILERPLEQMLASGTPEFPFCICWANEPWSRRWDGSEREMLIEQKHDLATDERFINDVLHILRDERYIKIKEAPLLLVYRVSLIPNPRALFESWRLTAAVEGIPRIHICMAETFGDNDPELYGCDSSVEFPPHGINVEEINEEISGLAPKFQGRIYSYESLVDTEIAKADPGYLRFRGIMPAWDNTPRRGLKGNVFVGSTPFQFEAWLRALVEYTKAKRSSDERLIFLNAWNEWGEGAHLEPDRAFGRQYLEATRRVLFDQSDWRVIIRNLRGLYDSKLTISAESSIKESLFRSLEQRLLSFENANQFFERVIRLIPEPVVHEQFLEGLPFAQIGIPTRDAICHFEHVDRFSGEQEITLVRSRALNFKGWCFCPSGEVTEHTQTAICLMSYDGEKSFSTTAVSRLERPDVVKHFNTTEQEALWSGFDVKIAVSNVAPGSYRVFVQTLVAGVVWQGFSELKINFI